MSHKNTELPDDCIIIDTSKFRDYEIEKIWDTIKQILRDRKNEEDWMRWMLKEEPEFQKMVEEDLENGTFEEL